jgi:hypothetical protein
MTSTYEKIAAVTVGTAGTSFLVMDSIPSTYTDLVLIINGSSASDVQPQMRLNNNSSSVYSSTVVAGNGTVAASGRTQQAGGSTAMALDYYFSLTSTSGAGTIIVNLMNYANTTTKKTILSRANNAGKGTSALVGLYDSTSAITRIDIISSVNISVGSTFTLYGIKAE